MLRLSHILTTAALVAVCAAPASAATFEDLHSTAQNDDASKLYCPPSTGSVRLARRGRRRSTVGRPRARMCSTGTTARPTRPTPRHSRPIRGSYVLNRDYGSPDAADAARDLPPVQIPVVEARDVPSSGFDWGDAGIGAAGMLAVFSIAGGSALLLTGRRRGHGIA